jgi:segregation and condensation protein A
MTSDTIQPNPEKAPVMEETAGKRPPVGQVRQTHQPGEALPPDEESDSAAYRLELPSFHGPLDLLLHLIKQHKVDIYDIPIVLITEQYNHYLDTMQELDLEVAADYVYMAAVLIHIKSKMLLPRDESEDDIADPRADLVDRLLDYQRFKSVAESFAEMDVVRMGMWSRPLTPRPGVDAKDIDMSEVSLFDLVDAFRQALSRYRHDHPQSIELVRTVHKVSDKMVEIIKSLAERSPLRLQWLLEGRDRNELIAFFLGVLELMRLGSVSLNQGEIFGEILIHKTDREIDASQFALYD